MPCFWGRLGPLGLPFGVLSLVSGGGMAENGCFSAECSGRKFIFRQGDCWNLLFRWGLQPKTVIPRWVCLPNTEIFCRGSCKHCDFLQVVLVENYVFFVEGVDGIICFLH